MQLLQKTIFQLVAWLRQYVSKPWYPPLLAILSAADAFLVFIPTDGLVVSSSMATPRRWFIIGAWTAFGSTAGALFLAYLASRYGLPWIDVRFPELVGSNSWHQISNWLSRFGVLFLFGYSATPLPQQPAVLLAGLSKLGLFAIGLSMFTGRLLKFSIIAYAGAKAPWLLDKLWGIKDELNEVGVVRSSVSIQNNKNKKC